MNKAIVTVATAGAVLSLCAGVPAPQVSGVSMSQNARGEATIDYTLSDASAVITLDIQTNATGGAWASIGGKAVSSAYGDVWKAVSTGTHKIKWDATTCWADHQIPASGIRAVVTAWALDNTPDYRVVDLTGVPAGDVARYYPSADFLPQASLGLSGNAVTNNPAYKTTKLLMRKIMAKGVEWTMGATTLESGRQASEATHLVTLTNNYYIGVFEVTQKQWELVATNSTRKANYSVTDADMRPMEQVCYNEIRLKMNSNEAATSSELADYSWPKDPYQGSFLGLLRLRTAGLDFDLPSEAQWEFAARAGNGDQRWGDGSPFAISSSNSDVNLDKLSRYRGTGGRRWDTSTSTWTDYANSCPASNATAIVGTYAPNNWGLYDMHGNVLEWCLDWHEVDITSYNGCVNIKFDNPAQTRGGDPNAGYRVSRGGSYYDGANGLRSGRRLRWDETLRAGNTGFRVVCTAGLR